MELLSSQTTDGSGNWFPWTGGVGTFWVRFASGTGTVTLEIAPNGNYAAVAAGDHTTLTADGQANFEAGVCLIRATLSSSSGASVSAGVASLPRG